MGARATEIEPWYWHPVITVPEHWAGRIELAQSQLTVKDIAVNKAEALLKIKWRQNLPVQNARFEIGSVARDGVNHNIGERFFLMSVRPASSSCYHDRASMALFQFQVAA